MIVVHAYDWIVRDAFSDDNKAVIHCWALDQQSKPYLLRFNDFPVFCHVELPTFVRNRPYSWRSTTVDNFMTLLSQRLGDDAPFKYTFKEARKTYYYRGTRKFPMIQLCFNTLEAMRHCTNLLTNPLKTDEWGFIKCNVWEADISMIRKLLTVRNIRYSQWFSVEGTKVDPDLRISTLENEYIAHWFTMEAIPLEQCKNWNTQPGILSFDIECYSHNHRAMPDKYNAPDVAYMISCIYQRYGDASSRKRYGIVIGDCEQIPKDHLDQCNVICVNNEIELVDAFAKVTLETDPEILTGYNILSFDYPYLDHRVKRVNKKWPILGRILGETSDMSSKTWKSGAYGYQSINILQMEGRISIDLLPIIKRDYKLDKYTLDFVCKTYIGKSKHDISAVAMFKIFESMKAVRKEYKENPNPATLEAFNLAKEETRKVLEYCIQDAELVIELMENLNVWVGLVEMSNIVGTTIIELFTRGQQIRCVSQLYDLAARSGFVLDKRDTPGFKFNGGYVFEPIPGLYENIICLDFSSLYPSIIQAYNICYTTLVPPEHDSIIPDSDCNVIEFDQEEDDNVVENEEVEEKEVLQEVGKRKKKEVKKILRHYRFKFYKNQEGLLPKLERQLVAERKGVRKQQGEIKIDTKAAEKKEELYKKLKEGKSVDLVAAEKNYKKLLEEVPPTRESMLDFAKLECDPDKEKVLKILEEEREERLKTIKDLTLLWVVLEKRQLAIKVSANSFFGFLGVHTGGKLPLIEAAMSITAKGRELIGLVRSYIETAYQGIQVAGDTDSVRGDSAVLVRYHTGAIDYKQIKDLIPLPPATEVQERYEIPIPLEVWSELGWTKINYLMRHKTTKQLFRVVTHTGVVEVTEDHSLLNENGQEIKPTQIELKKKLLHHDLPNIEMDNSDIDEEKAWLWGFFMAEGTCGAYTYGKQIKRSWSISNQNMDLLVKAQNIARRVEPNHDFIIDPCMVSSAVDKLNARTGQLGLDDLVDRYERMFYTTRSETVTQHYNTHLGMRYKKVPYEILLATKNIKAAFFKGWYDGDGDCKGASLRFDIKGQIGAAGLFMIISNIGYNVSVNTRLDKPDIYSFNVSMNYQRKHPDVIKKIIPLGTITEEVFDLETENHHFSAGVGRIVVHNSVMMDLHIKDSTKCDYWGKRLAEEITGIKPGEKDCDGVLQVNGKPGLFPPPLGMEFEKAMRLLCLTKKRYVAYLVAKDGTFKTEDVFDKTGKVIGKKKQMLKKGIILARRGNAKFLRDTYTKILETIMERQDLDNAVDILVDAIQNLLDGKIDHRDLVMIRELGANYKSDNFFMKVFSDDLKKAGKIVNPGDRLDFVIVQDNNAKLLGHKMRLVEQFEDSLQSDNPEKIDYIYYIEKILMNSINQLFEVGFKDTIAKLKNEVSFRPTTRHKTIYLEKPVKIILNMHQRGIDIQALKIAVKHKMMKLKEPMSSPEQVVTTEAPSQNSTGISTSVTKKVILNIVPKQPVVRQYAKSPPSLPGVVIPRIGTNPVKVVIPQIPPVTPITPVPKVKLNIVPKTN